MLFLSTQTKGVCECSYFIGRPRIDLSCQCDAPFVIEYRKAINERAHFVTGWLIAKVHVVCDYELALN